MVRALLVEDHPLFREGFTAMLARHRPHWTLESAGAAAEALEMLAAAGPRDLAIIDIQLPDIDGFEAARAPLMPRVMISGREDEAARLRSRDCGASGFLSKAWSPERMIAMVEQVLAGGVAFDLPDGPTVAGATLTARQLEVLSLLAEGHSNKGIERRMNIAPRTVRASISWRRMAGCRRS
ncbi:response regulator transcription factor [Phenylobacterium sp.]|uniref:response regulator transcription factor n=1 Tax=Phenylobacterium sp. TaxID=1871053 RepID=UPI0025EF107F|nr:response regulator transcription factor [Phenylobacterium sp.]